MQPLRRTRSLTGLAQLGTCAALVAAVALATPAAAQPNRAGRTPIRTPRTAADAEKGEDGNDAKPGNGAIGVNPDIAFKGPPPGGRVNFNMRDADLPDLVDAVMAITGRRFIYGGKVRSIKATVVSPRDVTAGEAYLAFLSVLEANGLTVVPHGRYLKIIDAKGAASETTPILGTAEPVPNVDRYVTRLYRLRNVDATEISNVLGKFKSADGDITVYPPSNLLIITDTGANIRRMLRITEELDAGGVGEQVYIQPVNNMGAAELAEKLNELLGGEAKSKLIADERNNALVMVASEDDYDRILELVKRIDVPSNGEGQIHVLPLQHARCDELQGTLGAITGSGGGAAPRPSGNARGRTAPAASSTSTGAAPDGIFEGNVQINCDEATNSLVTVSSLRDYAQLRNVIDRLDQPRRQVFIEAVIMDVNIDHTTGIGLGYHGGTTVDSDEGTSVIYGGFNAAQSLTGLPENLEALAFGVRGPDLEGTSQLLGTGVSIPGLGVVLHAIATTGDSNLLATPHILATDNIAAEISIGQNIPLQTNIAGGLGGLGGLAGLAGGQGAAGGLGALGALGGLGGFNAQRQDVGIRLSITPHVNDSNQVRMELSEEFSSAGAPQGELGAVPINKRTADTTIIVEDQQTVVIGGLTREEQTNGVTKIPVLGDIPVLGLLFRNSTKATRKVNLLLILTPHIIRNQNDLRRIFERKMQERQEFLDRYFVFDDSLPWEPVKDYSRTNGLLEHIRQSQLAIADRERLAAELTPEAPPGHEKVSPLQMPSMSGAGKTTTPTPSPRTNNRARSRARDRARARRRATRRRIETPGSVVERDRVYRVE